MVIPLWDDGPSTLSKRPVVTWGLILANVAVFVLELVTPDGMLDGYALVPAALTGAVVTGGVSPCATLLTSGQMAALTEQAKELAKQATKMTG